MCELTNLWPAAHPAPQLRDTLATAGLNHHDKATHCPDTHLGRNKLFSVRGNLTCANLIGLSYMSLFYFLIFIYLEARGSVVG
jgi:hypothetical protein